MVIIIKKSRNERTAPIPRLRGLKSNTPLKPAPRPKRINPTSIKSIAAIDTAMTITLRIIKGARTLFRSCQLCVKSDFIGGSVFAERVLCVLSSITYIMDFIC